MSAIVKSIAEHLLNAVSLLILLIVGGIVGTVCHNVLKFYLIPSAMEMSYFAAQPIRLISWTLLLHLLTALPELLCNLVGALTHDARFGLSVVLGSTLFHLLVGLGSVMIVHNPLIDLHSIKAFNVIRDGGFVIAAAILLKLSCVWLPNNDKALPEAVLPTLALYLIYLLGMPLLSGLFNWCINMRSRTVVPRETIREPLLHGDPNVEQDEELESRLSVKLSEQQLMEAAAHIWSGKWAKENQQWDCYKQGYVYGRISSNKSENRSLEDGNEFKLVWISLTDDGLSLTRGPWRVPQRSHYIVRKGEHVGHWKWEIGDHDSTRKLKLESGSCTLYLIAKTKKDAEEWRDKLDLWANNRLKGATKNEPKESAQAPRPKTNTQPASSNRTVESCIPLSDMSRMSSITNSQSQFEGDRKMAVDSTKPVKDEKSNLIDRVLRPPCGRADFEEYNRFLRSSLLSRKTEGNQLQSKVERPRTSMIFISAMYPFRYLIYHLIPVPYGCNHFRVLFSAIISLLFLIGSAISLVIAAIKVSLYVNIHLDLIGLIVGGLFLNHQTLAVSVITSIRGYSTQAVHETLTFVACRVLLILPAPYVLSTRESGQLIKEVTQKSQAVSAAYTFLLFFAPFITITLLIVSKKTDFCAKTIRLFGILYVAVYFLLIVLLLLHSFNIGVSLFPPGIPFCS